jgi:hypothetical protein
MLLHILDMVSLPSSQENLFAKLGVIGHLHTLMKISFFGVVQNLNSGVEKVLEPHVIGLAFEMESANNLITEVSALSNGLKVIFYAPLEVLLCVFASFVLSCIKVPFHGSNTLEAAAKKDKSSCSDSPGHPCSLCPIVQGVSF